MYEIKPDLYTGKTDYQNPVLKCADMKELITMIDFFFRNGYDVSVREIGRS